MVVGAMKPKLAKENPTSDSGVGHHGVNAKLNQVAPLPGVGVRRVGDSQHSSLGPVTNDSLAHLAQVGGRRVDKINNAVVPIREKEYYKRNSVLLSRLVHRGENGVFQSEGFKFKIIRILVSASNLSARLLSILVSSLSLISRYTTLLMCV